MWRRRDLEQLLPYRAAILAVAHCYHSRLNTTELRERYLKLVAEVMDDHGISAFDRKHKVREVITEEQLDYLNRMVRAALLRIARTML